MESREWLCWIWLFHLLIGFERYSALGFANKIIVAPVLKTDNLTSNAFRLAMSKHNNKSNDQLGRDPGDPIVKFEFPAGTEALFDLTDVFFFKVHLCILLKKGVFGFFGSSNATTISVISSMTEALHVPYLTYNRPHPQLDDHSSYILNMRPNFVDALIAIFKYHKWERVYYVYDQSGGLDRLQIIFDIIQMEGLALQIDVIRLEDVDMAYEDLRQLDYRVDKGDKIIVLDLSTERANQVVLRQIQNLGMNRINYHYIIGTLAMDELDLDSFKYGGCNITGFRLVPHSRETFNEWSKILFPDSWVETKQGRILKLNAALALDATEIYARSFGELVYEKKNRYQNVFRRGQFYNNATEGVDCFSDPPFPWVHGADSINKMRGLKFQGVSGFVSFDEYGMRQNYTLEVLELSQDSEPTRIGSWNMYTGLSIKREKKIKEVKKPPKNMTRIVTSIVSSPYLELVRDVDEDGDPRIGNARYQGYCVDLVEKIGAHVNFDYIIRLVKDGKYGAKMDNGTWNGMVGELTRNEAHMAIAPLTISSIRERVIDFSKPFMSLGISIMIKKPEKQKPGVFSFMDPLSKEIWMCIIFAYIGVSVVLFLVSRFSPYEWQIEDSHNGPSFTNDFTILNSLWFSLGAFMQQGCDISPRSMSGRIVGSVWWFFTLIIISSYTANLAAFLTVERMLTPIESADDLAKQTEIQYGTLNSGSTKTFFQSSRIAVYERMWAFMESAEPSVFEETTELGVSRVRNSKGKYAFLMESTMNDYYNQRKPCNTMKVGGNLDSKGYGVATPLNSDLREPISLSVLHLREIGELQKLHKKWWYDKGECGQDADSKGSSQSALTLSNVAGIFYILIGGLGMSMVISLLEFLYKSRAEARRRQATFGAAQVRNKRPPLSRAGSGDRENGGVGGSDLAKSMSTVPIARSSAVSLV